jgi:hypothetical protein
LREKASIANVRPWPEYKHLFANCNDAELDQLAYDFDYESVDAEGNPTEWQSEMISKVEAWKTLELSGETFLAHDLMGEDNAIFYDNRPAFSTGGQGIVRSIAYPGINGLIKAIEEIRSIDEVARIYEKANPRNGREGARQAMEQLEMFGLAVSEGERILGLSLPF